MNDSNINKMTIKKIINLLFYLTVIILSLLSSCLISLLGAGMLILSSKNIANNKTTEKRIILSIKFLVMTLLLVLGRNLSCIINKLYLNSENKTKL